MPLQSSIINPKDTKGSKSMKHYLITKTISVTIEARMSAESKRAAREMAVSAIQELEEGYTNGDIGNGPDCLSVPTYDDEVTLNFNTDSMEYDFFTGKGVNVEEE